jgi:hypothetical protein
LERSPQERKKREKTEDGETEEARKEEEAFGCWGRKSSMVNGVEERTSKWKKLKRWPLHLLSSVSWSSVSLRRKAPWRFSNKKTQAWWSRIELAAK